MPVKGNVGIIVCPMLEDELVFSLENDTDPKNIYVVDNDYIDSFTKKLDNHKVHYNLMDEYTLNSDMCLDDEQFNIVILLNPMRLHSEPEKLRKKIEEQANFHCNRFDVLVLYYAMCGNYGWDISEWMSHRTETPILVFRDEEGHIVDDCVGVAVGGKKEYYDLVRKYTGQLFLTPCTATNWGKYSENKEWMGSFDSEDEYMKFLFKIGGYKYALKVDTGIGDRERYDLACEEVAKRMELELHDPDEPIATTKLATKLYSEMKQKLSERRS